MDRGCRTVDSLGMLVQQGAIGIKYWNDIDIGPMAIQRAFLAFALQLSH